MQKKSKCMLRRVKMLKKSIVVSYPEASTLNPLLMPVTFALESRAVLYFTNSSVNVVLESSVAIVFFWES